MDNFSIGIIHVWTFVSLTWPGNAKLAISWTGVFNHHWIQETAAWIFKGFILVVEDCSICCPLKYHLLAASNSVSLICNVFWLYLILAVCDILARTFQLIYLLDIKEKTVWIRHEFWDWITMISQRYRVWFREVTFKRMFSSTSFVKISPSNS